MLYLALGESASKCICLHQLCHYSVSHCFSAGSIRNLPSLILRSNSKIVIQSKATLNYLYDEILYYIFSRFSADEPGYSAKQEFKIQENLNKDVLLYQLCYLTEKIKPTPISLIISNVKVFLTSEYHQWPLPRLQPPLPLHLRGQHFQVRITHF